MPGREVIAGEQMNATWPVGQDHEIMISEPRVRCVCEDTSNAIYIKK